MPKSTVFDYAHPEHGNVMREWSLRLQVKERAKLNNKIDALALHGAELIPGLVAPTRTASIFKLKVQGQVKLRPMLCEGPGEGEPAFTLLLGAFEIQWEYDPANAPDIAAGYRADLLAHPTHRREHERVS
jgi:hypothetical protein